MKLSEVLLTLCVLLIWLGVDANAQEPSPDNIISFLETAGNEGRFSAAAITILDENGQVHGRAFGDANPLRGDAANFDTTRFLTASLTKTFTSLAVVQLHDRGEISSLDDPANTYLKRITLPNWRGKNITVRDLLTHRSGLDVATVGIVTREELPAPTPSRLAQKRTPDLVRAPGETIVYSNIGMAIAGALVEDITDQSLQDYFENEIFVPLEMKRALLNYLPEPKGDYARPAIVSKDEIVPSPFVANTPFFAPAGSVMASGADMARYLEFWRAGLAGLETPLLSVDAFNEVVSPQARNHPGLPAIGLGVFLYEWNGAVVLDHTGAFSGTTSYMAVSPETGRAGFVSVAGGPTPEATVAPLAAYGEAADLLLAYLTGRPAATMQPRATPRLADYPGAYLPERRAHKGIPGFLGASGVSRAELDGDGFLRFGTGPSMGEVTGDLLVSEGGAGSSPSMLGLGLDGDLTLYGISDVRRPASILQRGDTLTILFVIGLILSVVGLSHIAAPGAGKEALARRIAQGLLPSSGLAILGALVLGFRPGENLLLSILYGDTWRLYIVFGAALLGLVASATLCLSAILSGRSGAWSDSNRPVVWRTTLLVSFAGALLMGLFYAVSGLATPSFY